MKFLDFFKITSPRLSSKKLWKKTIVWLNNDEITLQEFVNLNANMPLFYSTLAGVNQEGEKNIWWMKFPGHDFHFYPVYTSPKKCRAMLSNAGRRDFVILEGTLESALSMLDDLVLEPLGLIIFDDKGKLPLPPEIRVQK